MRPKQEKNFENCMHLTVVGDFELRGCFRMGTFLEGNVLTSNYCRINIESGDAVRTDPPIRYDSADHGGAILVAPLPHPPSRRGTK